MLIAAAALAGCGARSSSDTGTQIAARVNREEISVHQVNYFLRRQGATTPEQAEAAGRQTLEALVDQELAVQAALEQKLDRDPVVMQSLEAARRELLARAYAERLAQGVPAPTPQEVRQYFDSKPALFARRRLYTLVDTAIDATPEEQKAIAAQLPTTRGTSDIALVLRQSGLRYGSRRTSMGAEALPLHVVDKMATLNEGQSLLVGGPRDAHIFTVIEARPAPLNLEEARGAIENFLIAERRRTALEQQIKALRSDARIEYHGRFAQQVPAEAKPLGAAASGAEPANPTVALEDPARNLSKTSYPNK
ncbi:EpsD family peptidyl-prolyl cis-trans isomerase [Piscinibacter sp. HJYY11]|uniref:EpsD family peptidyl-prolyl cis-trans isomerase n=1 Tax=Piscinibacter sp. HJYY11 TaxID=2801333 RepID=UPI00191FB7BD|nr:EpsD family peptidyl-prolyl cis-trans isomerase [Piscinibacter sp. HJYY11]MBL0730687.1 EpsD family peptidyl-prolyl cis-trans isomerase [Piscinibacter sp. HJYY11]